MVLPHRPNGKFYIITNDLGARVESLRTLGLKTPDADDHLFVSFHDETKRLIAGYLPDVQVISYDMRSLAEQVWMEAIKLQGTIKDAVVISTCVELASSRRGHILEANRVFDEHGKMIGLGPRPGNTSLQSQINGVSAVVNGSPVVLAEDGAFTGDTIVTLLRLFKKRRVTVSVVVVGICFPGAKEAIEKEFDGKICVISEIDHPYEWMPDHDFIPFAPNCGRVFGGSFGEEILPHYTHESFSYCFPYVLPFGDPVEWASIPKEHAPNFSAFCLEQSLSLFCRLDEMNGKKIRMIDLLGSTPRVSAPMTKGSNQLPNVDGPISDFLAEVIHEF